jgi:hypothetical protein
MINKIVTKLMDITKEMNQLIQLDMQDVRKANHKNLVDRNSVKLELMDSLASYKQQLNKQLAIEYNNNVDISIYKQSIDTLETSLKELYYANGKLASIVLPVKEMYKDIIDEITKQNGGTLIEVMA